MLLLHVSDIHFCAPACTTPALDPDRPYRTRLVQDVRAHVQSLGNVDAILISGDIAYRGVAEEYESATAWIRELATAAACQLERVFVVPGNHDIDRRVILETPSVRNAQQAIARADPKRRERELREQFRDSDTGRALLAPLAAYNSFAAQFNCQVFPPERLYWHQDLPIDNRLTLRLYGLTSTLLSGAGAPRDSEDTRLSLYLSPLQTVLDPVDNVVNLVLCHHPPDWFMDQDDVEDAIRGRAGLHLFGHKHRQRIFKDDGYVRLAAGAVNPDRLEGGWFPGYNLIKLLAPSSPNSHELDIEMHLLAWQPNPDQFRPTLNPQGEPIFRHRIPIAGMTARNIVSTLLDRVASVITAKPVNQTREVVDSEVPMSDDRTRNLVFRFWNLPSSERRRIAFGLGLIDEREMALPEPERYGRALIRAGQRGLLDKVAHEIEDGERRS